MRDVLGERLRRFLVPLVRTLDRYHITPNQITVVGAGLNLTAAILVSQNLLLIAGIVFVFSSCFDMLDGTLARYTQKVTPFGAFLDSTLDRMSEGAMLVAIAYLFALDGHPIDVAFAMVAMIGSLLVSYTRARAEVLGLECKVGLMSRPERIVLVAIGLFFNVLPYVVYILAVLTMFTVVQRVIHTYRELRRAG
jgi:CDP-diacylglycerol--glycerol-3-phosphate 3-phosphatidyltransferase